MAKGKCAEKKVGKREGVAVREVSIIEEKKQQHKAHSLPSEEAMIKQHEVHSFPTEESIYKK